LLSGVLEVKLKLLLFAFLAMVLALLSSCFSSGDDEEDYDPYPPDCTSGLLIEIFEPTFDCYSAVIISDNARVTGRSFASPPDARCWTNGVAPVPITIIWHNITTGNTGTTLTTVSCHYFSGPYIDAYALSLFDFVVDSLQLGENIITVTGTDQFGRTGASSITLIGEWR
jgi:hypothetical protein